MADHSRRPASFWTQSNALLRKNLTIQKRNMCSNVSLVLIPAVFCSIIAAIQFVADKELGKKPSDDKCESSNTTFSGGGSCPIPKPAEWPPLLQIPDSHYRAVRSDFVPFTDLPDESCRKEGSCPVTVLLTGNNQSFGEIMAGNLFLNTFSPNSSGTMDDLASNVLGSESTLEETNFFDEAIMSDLLYNVQQQCSSDSIFHVLVPGLSVGEVELRACRCVQGLHLWRNTSSAVNNELYRGYRMGNSEKKINEIFGAYDFSNSNANNFNVRIWYNSTLKDGNNLLRIPRSVNLASSAYLQFLQGYGTKMLFNFVKEMPKPETVLRLDFSSLLGTIFFTWVILQLFPVVLKSLVYEKQQKLRIMMKMHGLGDGPYWMISYMYFLIVSSIYMLCFIIFGSVLGLKFFTLNHYSVQFIFYFTYINLQIALGFLAATMFSSVKTSTVIGYIFVFGTGLCGASIFEFFVQDTSLPRIWIFVLELYPGFSLYRGLYEFAQYSFEGNYVGTIGMQWENLSDRYNGMSEVLIIMTVEWVLMIFLAYYIDQVESSGSGKSTLFFLQSFRKKKFSTSRMPSLEMQESKVSLQMEKPDVSDERDKVDMLLVEQDPSHAIICDNLEKVYPGRDGNPQKFAVRGLSLALPRGECFGMLGPNGAGKTSFINMMVGLTKPTSGTAYVQGLDIQTQMNEIYTSMGVCPQHDLLWETLTGKEHLLFYGRLKNLKGSALIQAVKESLRSFNLLHGGVADKQVRKYSGGMKRRLSVAISLLGDPKVVYMDEPSSGLDPASRKNLWNVVKGVKQDRAIILTTHSMEEAEFLCDRLGIFADGRLQCIGNPKELKARYGGSYVLTITANWDHQQEVESLVRNISPSANKVYQLSGTQKFELPKNEVRIADVFETVEQAKSRFTIFAWGLADTTLEDVFIKVASGSST